MELVNFSTLIIFAIFTAMLATPIFLSRTKVDEWIILIISSILIVFYIHPQAISDLPAPFILIGPLGGMGLGYSLVALFSTNFKRASFLGLSSLWTWLLLHYVTYKEPYREWFLLSGGTLAEFVVVVYFYTLPTMFLLSLLRVVKFKPKGLDAYVYLSALLLASVTLLEILKATNPDSDLDVVVQLARSLIVAFIGGTVALIVTPAILKLLGYGINMDGFNLVKAALTLSLFCFSVGALYGAVTNVENPLEQLALSRYGVLMMFILAARMMAEKLPEDAILRKYEEFFDYGAVLGFILIPLSFPPPEVENFYSIISLTILRSLTVIMYSLLFVFMTVIPSTFYFALLYKKLFRSIKVKSI